VWYAVFFLCPLGIMVVFSFAKLSGYTGFAYAFDTANYRALWDPVYGTVFLRTLGLAAFGTAATLLVGFPLAYYLARYARRKTLILLLVVVPFWTSFLIRTYSWLIILDGDFPPTRALKSIGVLPDDFDLTFTTTGIYIGVVYNYLPLMVLPLYATLERMDWSLVEAAEDLGDNALRAFRRVTLPLTLPGVVAGSLLVFIPLTGEYLVPQILGGGKKLYAGNLIAQEFLEARDWPFGAAIAMVVIGALTVLLLVYARAASKQEEYVG
jgi:spermidine/putrescine transport system permease protein